MYRVKYEPPSDKLIDDDGVVVAEVINRAYVPVFAYAHDLRAALRRLVEAVNKGEPVLDALMTAALSDITYNASKGRPVTTTAVWVERRQVDPWEKVEQ